MTATQTLHTGAELASRVRSRVNTHAIQHDIQRPFRFLFCGDPGLVASMRAALLSSYLGVEPSSEAPRLLETLNVGSRPTMISSDIRCVIHLAYPQDDGPPLDMLAQLGVPILAIELNPATSFAPATGAPARAKVEKFSVASLEPAALQGRVFPFIVECCKSVEVAVGKSLPILRDSVCLMLTREAARSALKIAAASAIVEQVPILGFVVGAFVAAGDTVAISVLQLTLLLKIGAVFDRDPQIGTVWELVPIVGGGLGWRALSRELSGFIPAAGVVIKAAISYAGTMVVGEGAAFYYRTGRYMSAADAKALYADTKRAALDMARELVGRLRGRN